MSVRKGAPSETSAPGSDGPGDSGVPAEWQGILQPGERILWQGAPRQAFHWRREYRKGLAGALILLLLRPLGNDAMEDALALLIPLVALGQPLWDAFRRRYAFYTLTDRRGIVGLDMPLFGRRLLTYPAVSDAPLRLETSGARSAVYFAQETRDDRRRVETVPAGFENLAPDDAAHVHALIAELREEGA